MSICETLPAASKMDMFDVYDEEKVNHSMSHARSLKKEGCQAEDVRQSKNSDGHPSEMKLEHNVSEQACQYREAMSVPAIRASNNQSFRRKFT